MEAVMFMEQWEPSEVEVAGAKVRMLFTLRAAARMEQALGKPYADLVLEMLQIAPEGKEPAPAMGVERQAVIVRLLMEEAGQAVTEAQLRGLHMLQFSRLARAAQREMLQKLPQAQKKTTFPDVRPNRPAGHE